MRVTMAEAARQLGQHRSTVTRWCKAHPALLDEDGRVSVEELREHRDTVVNPALQTKASRTSQRSDGAAAVSGMNADRGRRERANADMAELDLAERLGQTLRRDDVEMELAAAAETLRSVAGQIVKDRAERLALLSDVRAVEVELEQIMRDLMDKAASALEAAAGESRQDAA